MRKFIRLKADPDINKHFKLYLHSSNVIKLLNDIQKYHKQYNYINKQLFYTLIDEWEFLMIEYKDITNEAIKKGYIK